MEIDMAKAAALVARTSSTRKSRPAAKKAPARKPPRQMSEEEKARRAAEREEDERSREWHRLCEAGECGPGPVMTMEDLIVALGGPIEIGNWLYVNDPPRWIEQGHVDMGYGLRVYLALNVMGYRHINPKLFGFTSWNSVLPPRMRLSELPTPASLPGRTPRGAI
jgi:hypothetical protein